MKINKDRFDALSVAMKNAWDDCVSVGEYTEYQVDGRKKRYKVNWSALGAVDSETAFKFSDWLLGAGDIAHMLNERKIKFVYLKELDPDMKTESRFNEVVETLTEWLKEKKYRNIEAWIVAGSEYVEQ